MEQDLYSETLFIMKKYGIIANKKLGQNFLIDEFVIEEICDTSNVNSSDLIIEIGPGIGSLTSVLLSKAGKVISIELDKKMLNILNDRFKFYNNFELINEDILKVDLKTLINKNLNEHITNCKIVANLPYYITTPIIIKLLEDDLNIDSITVMVQKEVAQRLVAIPGTKNSGAISYLIYYYTDSNLAINVFRDSFIPSPDVDSAVINMKFLKEPRIKIENKKLFFDIIKSAFSQKRKTLVNSLVNNKIFDSKETAEEALTSIGLDTKIRAEKLTLDDFKKIYEIIISKK